MQAENPPFLIPVGKRGDARRLELLGRLLQLAQGFGQVLDARFCKKLLIVHISVALNAQRHAIQLAVLQHRLLGYLHHIFHPGFAAQILQMLQPHIPFGIPAHVENIRRFIGGKFGLQRRSVIRTATHGLNLQLDTGVGGFILRLHLVHLLGNFHLELEDLHRDILLGCR
ncbi:hypothetical protein D3C75_747760 [compost metagenome]